MWFLSRQFVSGFAPAAEILGGGRGGGNLALLGISKIPTLVAYMVS